MKQFVVYWLYDEHCSTPQFDGYVGVTGDFEDRMRRHRKRFGLFEIQILFRGTEAQCYALEYALRPSAGLGWNSYPGGPEAYKGRCLTEEVRAKLKLPKSEAHKRATGLGNKGKKRTPEQIERLRQSHLGYKMPEEQRAKISAAMKGRHPEAATQAATLAWKNGTRVPGMTGRKHDAETRAKMSAVRKAFYENRRATMNGNPTPHIKEL